MKILAINTGSSTIKYRLFEMPAERTVSAGLLDKIGGGGRLTHEFFNNDTHQQELLTLELKVNSHKDGMALIIDILTSKNFGAIPEKNEIGGIGHRVVHGGEHFREPVFIDDGVIEIIRQNSRLAPVHNPANLAGIEAASSFFPSTPQVAVFDTAFHQTIPPRAFRYAVPTELYEKFRVRRYGFHGASFSYVMKKAAALLGGRPEEFNLILLHLGNGASMAAVEKGLCIDTTMGMTPLEGLVMGSRSGDVDPALHLFLSENAGLSLREIDDLLNRKSGLKGLCGTNDMRDILERKHSGDSSAALAVDIYAYRIKKYIGAFYAVLGGAAAIVFTGGTGENSSEIRSLSCAGLERLGISIDPDKNAAASALPRNIGEDGGEVKILVVPTNEELEIAGQTYDLIEKQFDP